VADLRKYRTANEGGKSAPETLSYYRAWAFRNAAQRRFVASMIAARPAALSLRFFRAGTVDEAAPACFFARSISSVGPLRSWHEPQQTLRVVSSARVSCRWFRPGSTFGEGQRFER